VEISRELIRQKLEAEPFVQVIFDLEVPRMAFGRVCLIGDAAFTARPHAGAGTAKAAEDSWTLAQTLRTRDVEVVEALGHWEVGQIALGRQLVARSRNAGERLQHDRWSVGEPPPVGLYRIGDTSRRTSGPNGFCSASRVGRQGS